MRSLSASIRVQLVWPVALLLGLAAAMSLPATASALEFQIVNQSDHSLEDVYVTVAGEAGTFDVPGMVDDEPKQLSEIPGQTLTIEKLISGRVYIAYGAGVQNTVPFSSPIRFDWAELTVTPASSDVANLTAVDQFGIGMRLDTYDESGEPLETVGDANSDTVFQAMQQIPGGPQATVRDSGGNILRVLSPLHSSAYPDLGDYVRSMSGKTITLHTAFFNVPFVTSDYSGTFAANGSIALSGTSDPAGEAPSAFTVPGDALIEDIYTGANTPNDLEGTIRRDLLAGFSTGLWGGKYGDDALSFCTNPMTTPQGSWCPTGFNQPAFGDARTELSPFPTCEQYAAVINEYTDAYGNPYSDASKKVTVGLDQPSSGGAVKTLQLTILPDSGNAQPQAGGNPNCGAAVPPSTPAQPAAPVPSSAVPALHAKVRFHLRRRAKAKGRTIKVGRLSCSASCGRVKAIARRDHTVIARRILKRASPAQVLVLRLTRVGRRALARTGRLKARVNLWITPPGHATRHARRSLVLIAPR